jgi:hypothetical protein
LPPWDQTPDMARISDDQTDFVEKAWFLLGLDHIEAPREE